MYNIFFPRSIISKHNFVSSAVNNSEMYPFVLLNTCFFINKLQEGNSFTNNGLSIILYLIEDLPVNDDESISPDAFCKILSFSGVKFGPPTAPILSFFKYFSAFFNQSLSGYASESIKARTSALDSFAAIFLFIDGFTFPVGIIFVFLYFLFVFLSGSKMIS